MASVLICSLLFLQIGPVDVFMPRCISASACVGGDARLPLRTDGLPFAWWWDQHTCPALANFDFFLQDDWQLCILANGDGVVQLQKPRSGTAATGRGTGDMASVLICSLLFSQIGPVDVFMPRCISASACVGGDARLPLRTDGLPFAWWWDQQTCPALANFDFFLQDDWQLCILANGDGVVQLQKPRSGTAATGRGTGDMASVLICSLLFSQIGPVDVFMPRCISASACVGGDARLPLRTDGLPFAWWWDQQTCPALANFDFFLQDDWQLCILANGDGVVQLQKPRSGTAATGRGTGDMASVLICSLLFSQIGPVDVFMPRCISASACVGGDARLPLRTDGLPFAWWWDQQTCPALANFDFFLQDDWQLCILANGDGVIQLRSGTAATGRGTGDMASVLICSLLFSQT
ncbi:hypothetical protein MTO96_016365 [Rhipicephalus appendiculatus]